MKARTWAALLLALLALGCKPSEQAQAASEEEGIGLQIQVLNYMDEGLGVVYVNGVWAGSMRNHSGGTSVAGSVGLPAKWHPGLTVEVQWQDDTLYKQDHDALHKTQVSVQPYETGEPATLWLAFMPSNKIRAIASRYTPHNPKFPGGLKFPYDVCMADPACAAKFYRQRAPTRSGNP